MESVALWVLTLINTVGIVLILRQLASGPPVMQRSNPAIGSVLPTWSLQNLEGRTVSSLTLPASYVLVATSTSCIVCNDLFRDLAQRKVDTGGRAYLISAGDPSAVREAVHEVPQGYFREVLVGATLELLTKLHVPATPYAIAVRDGKVVAAKSATRGFVIKELIDGLEARDHDGVPHATRLPEGPPSLVGRP
jgi:hypothetical protein